MDLDEIVEGFKLNIDRIADQRLLEIGRMIADELTEKDPSCEWELKASRKMRPTTLTIARLNLILDKVEKEVKSFIPPTIREGEITIYMIRKELDKL
jgi:hypothetical protein